MSNVSKERTKIRKTIRSNKYGSVKNTKAWKSGK